MPLQREKVPLLKPWKEETGSTPPRNAWTIFFGVLKHTMIHALTFMLFSIIFMLGYHRSPDLIIVPSLILFLGLLGQAAYIHRARKRVTSQSLRLCICAFCILLGSIVGTRIEYNHLADYWPYYDKRHYTNVAPDEPAASRADASVIVFMHGARPDSTRSMGYQRYGSIYCVAPIALEAGYSDEETISSDIQYWAVGKDCCGGNKGFDCEDAQKPKARTGLVLVNRTVNDPTIFENFFSNNDENTYYEKAVLMTESKFDLTSPKERMYVRFVEDIAKARLAMWNSAWWSWFKHQGFFLFLWTFASLFVVIVGAGDDQDTNKYSEHAIDFKQNVLSGLNHYI